MIHLRPLTRSSLIVPCVLAGAVAVGGCGQQKVNWSMPAPTEAPAPPPAKLVAIDPALQAAARAELERGAASNDADVRAHAIEALSQTVGASAKSGDLGGLRD